MTKHKPPCSLYSLTLERLQLVVADYAIQLALLDGKTTEIRQILDEWKGAITERLPRLVLEDIVNTFDAAMLKSSRELCFYYLLTLRPDLQRFLIAKLNSSFSIYEWNEIFVRNTFKQLTWLDCGRNCTDHVLYLISLNCPNLEYLNAAARRKPFIIGSNATLLHDRMTDIGIEFVAQRCLKLRTLIMNDPRNGAEPSPVIGQRRQSIHTLSTAGYRLLLRSLPNLEYISYANIGGILATEMEDIQDLNLRLVQHYNPTVESIREILRLCPQMEKLNLVSFIKCPANKAVLDQVIIDHPPLTTINLKNMSSRLQLSILCDTFRHLTELNITESFDHLSVDNLLAIGATLTYLKHLRILGYRPESACDSFRGHHFQGQLETLILTFVGQYSEPAFQFCVSNAEHSLRNCTLTVDGACEEHLVRRLMEKHSFPVLYELVLFPGFLTTMEEVLDLITHFPKLEQFTGWCLGDISPIACLIQEHNLNFSFSNIKRRSLLD